jgi:hypothetical protein
LLVNIFRLTLLCVPHKIFIQEVELKANKLPLMKYILCLLLGCFLQTITAQDYMDIASIYYAYSPANDFEDKSGQTNLSELALQLNFPFVLNEQNILLTGLAANHDRLQLDTNLEGLTSLNSLGFQIGLHRKYSKKWAASYILLPKIAFGQRALTINNLQIGVASLFSFIKNKNLTYKFGFYANTEKFGLMLVPLAGLYYLSENQKFEITMLLPSMVDLNYALFNKTHAGIGFDSPTSSYYLNKSLYSNDNVYVVKVSNELFAHIKYQLGKSIYFKIEVGYPISRHYKVFNADDKVDFALGNLYFGDKRVQLNHNIDTGLIFKIKLVYRIHLN